MARLFDLPQRTTKAGDHSIAIKVKTKAKASGVAVHGNGGSLLEKISTISALVTSRLGKYADRYLIIRDEKQLDEYIGECLKNGIIVIDTETNKLDPILATIAGICIYTPTMKAAYVPIHHVSYITGIEVDNQISTTFIAAQLMRIKNEAESAVRSTKFEIVMFNAKFDVRVLKNQLGVKLTATWDCYLAARLLNENEGDGNNNLKSLHRKYCSNGEGDAFSFLDLFSDIPFTHIPINIAYLYAARDPEITFELFMFQKPFLTPGDPACVEKGLMGVSSVFHNIEMPLISVICDMEDRGIEFDPDFAGELSRRYHELLSEKEVNFFAACEKYKSEIEKYKRSNPAHKLGNPINIASPTQLAILLYDVIGVVSVSKNEPRGTGEYILSQIDLPVCKAILEYRGISKLLTTYVDKMPKIVNPKTGRIHCSFNQYGADTGRFSSSDPNMQNIPSHTKEIRQMFKAQDGWVLISSDYSAQEPRITAHMSRDAKMMAAYCAGKDLYAEVAAIAFKTPYEDCLEFRPDGTTNAKGKERRGRAKAIVLGVCYGKGVPAIADDLQITRKLAQEIYDKIMVEFPGLKQFMIDSENMAKECGFVTTVWGRKRRLPNIQLPPYVFTLDAKKTARNFDPLEDATHNDPVVGDNGLTQRSVDPESVRRYTRLLSRCRSWDQKEGIIAEARAEGIIIKDNGGYIAEARRQSINSRIQGSAADQTKMAMILIGNDQRLKELDFHLLLTVHDELIGECPEENAGEAAARFSSLMVEAAKDLLVPSKCDVKITRKWYGPSLDV